MYTLSKKHDWFMNTFMNTFTGMYEYYVYSMYIFRYKEKKSPSNKGRWGLTFTKSLHSIHALHKKHSWKSSLTLHKSIHTMIMVK